MRSQTKRKIGSESASSSTSSSLLELSKEYFRKVFSGEWLKPDTSKLALLTPQERIQQREFLRKRIKWMIWGFMGMVAFGVPLFNRCKSSVWSARVCLLWLNDEWIFKTLSIYFQQFKIFTNYFPVKFEIFNNINNNFDYINDDII